MGQKPGCGEEGFETWRHCLDNAPLNFLALLPLSCSLNISFTSAHLMCRHYLKTIGVKPEPRCECSACCFMVLHRASSLYVKRIGLSGCSTDKAYTSKEADLITATALATAEQISATTHSPVNNTARSSNGHKPLTDNKLAFSAQRGGSLTLSSQPHSLFPSLNFILRLSATSRLVLVNETKSNEMHQNGYCSQWNTVNSPWPPAPYLWMCTAGAHTQIQRIVVGCVVRESDRQRGLCNSRGEAQARTMWCNTEM